MMRSKASPKGNERKLKAEGFTTKSRMKNAVVVAPPAAGAFAEKPLSQGTSFRKFYNRGDFPIALEHDTKGNKIAWKVSSSKVCFCENGGLKWNGVCPDRLVIRTDDFKQ